MREKSLTPTIATLKDSSFYMLLKGSTYWWNTPYRNCLCKQLLSSFIYFIRDAGMIIDEYNKSFGYIMIYSGITGGACASLIRALVSSGKEFHVDQAVLFPCPAKAEMAAHPVNAWNKGSGHAFVGPKQVHILWATKYWKLLPFPNASQMSCSGDSVSANTTANTNTSVSAVRISIS